MKRALLLFALLACGDEDPCDDRLPPGLDRGPRELPPTDDDGTPWPTYSEALAQLQDCTEPESYYGKRSGTCSDGKRFLSRSGGLSGDLRYYDGEALVGISPWSDAIDPCVDYRQGDTGCEFAFDVEEIVCP